MPVYQTTTVRSTEEEPVSPRTSASTQPTLPAIQALALSPTEWSSRQPATLPPLQIPPQQPTSETATTTGRDGGRDSIVENTKEESPRSANSGRTSISFLLRK